MQTTTTHQFTADGIAGIRSAPSASVHDAIQDAADAVLPFEVDWIDDRFDQDFAGAMWRVYGHTYIDGQPSDVVAIYAIDRRGSVTVAHGVLTPATHLDN